MAAETSDSIHAGQRLDPAVPPRARRLGLALVVISMAQLMLVLDELIVNTALPHIQQALHFSGTGLEWVVTGYAVTFGGLLLLGGRAGDILGRRRMFSAGIGIFTLASLLGGFAIHSWLLITARVLQGTGAALAAPAALSLIAVTFPEGKPRTRALAVYAAMTGMGGGVGLIAGGLLTTYASWRWVFFVNVPVGLLLAFGARYVLPESQRHPRRWDLPGAVTSTAGFALLIYGLTRGVPMTIGAVLAPVSMFWLARVHEHSHYLTGVCLPLLVFAATAGLIFVPLTMTLVAGISDEHSGVASSMFNAGQQVGGAVGLAVIGSVAWTVVNSHVKDSLGRLSAGHAAAVQPGSPVYDHALATGVTAALTIGAGATVLALVVTLVTIRVRRQDLPDSPLVM